MNRPANVSASEQMSQVLQYFQYWKNKYIKRSNGNTPGGGYYVEMQGLGPRGKDSKTTSEAHGYGMLIFALLAPYIEDSKIYFDGFYNMYDKHRSKNNSFNMSWIITESETEDFASSTDGDMDVAYALLVAHQRWGSKGKISYLDHAQEMIEKGIQQSDFTPTGRPNLGDWDKNLWNSRSSDWMPDHFRSYWFYTRDSFWVEAVAEVYSMIETVQNEHSPRTGLLPDFIVGEKVWPAKPDYLGENSVDFSWNACRFPLRLAVDYHHFNSKAARKALIKVMDWVMEESEGDPSQIKAGYFLNGKPQVDYSDMAFVAPMVAASTIDPKYQDFLNRGWGQLVKSHGNYYDDSLNLLSLLLISGIWKSPMELNKVQH